MAYISSKQERDRIKAEVFESLAQGSKPVRCGLELYQLCGFSVHARYCHGGAGNYKFNINPNSLRANYELWICGDTKHWYLLPIQVILQMYQHPAAYPDNHHPEIRVVSVNDCAHQAKYAKASAPLNLRPYFRAQL